MTPELLTQAYQSTSRSLLVRAVIISMLVSLCAGGLLVVLLGGGDWTKIGEILFQAGMTGFVLWVLLRAVAHADDPKIINNLRASLFRQLQQSVLETNAKLIRPATGAARLFDYSPVEHRWHQLSSDARRSFIANFRPYTDDRTFAVYARSFDGVHRDEPAILIVSLWMYGRSAHIGVFVHRSLYDRLAGAGASERLIAALPGYFICGDDQLIQRDRGDYALIDHVMTDGQILTDRYIHDAIQNNFCHVLEHLIVTVESQLASTDK